MKIVRKFIVLFTLLIMFSGITTPAVVSADAKSGTDESATLTNTDPNGIINSYNFVNGPTQPTITYNAVSDETVINITDAQMRQLLIENGASASDLGRFGFARSNGVTKIIWHGKARKGNVDLYLSKNTMLLAKAGKFVYGQFSALVKVYFGRYYRTAYTFVKSVTTACSMRNVKSGRVYHMRNWHYKGYTKQ